MLYPQQIALSMLNEYFLNGLIDPFLLIIFKLLSVTGTLSQPQTHSSLPSSTELSLDPAVPSATILFLPCIFWHISQIICACCCLIVTTSSHHTLVSLHNGCRSNAVSSHQTPHIAHLPNCPFSSTPRNFLYTGFLLSLGILFSPLWCCLPKSTLSKTNLHFPLYSFLS